jgi:hypothetical protein
MGVSQVVDKARAELGPSMDETQPFIREGAVEEMRKSIKSGNKLRTENRMIRMRSATEAVVFAERVIEKDGAAVARIFHVETHRLLDGAWMLMRETMEQVAL